MKTESVSIRYVTDKDKAFWFRLDRHLPESEFDRKVRDQQGYHFPEKKD